MGSVSDETSRSATQGEGSYLCAKARESIQDILAALCIDKDPLVVDLRVSSLMAHSCQMRSSMLHPEFSSGSQEIKKKRLPIIRRLVMKLQLGCLHLYGIEE